MGRGIGYIDPAFFIRSVAEKFLAIIKDAFMNFEKGLRHGGEELTVVWSTLTAYGHLLEFKCLCQ